MKVDADPRRARQGADMTSRERFELGGESFLRRLKPLPVNPENYGETIKVKAYFDTCDAGPQLAEYQAKAGEQSETVLAIFQARHTPLSPSQVLELYPLWGNAPPLTSIRRAITTLTQSGALVKTGAKRKGVYGRQEHVWTLPEAKP